ncbi:helix-turn-helix domain-containing protein, partial [Chloroflexota bacterium]
MTVQISLQKIRSILKLYLAGWPQVAISQKTGVNQSTISDYANYFKQSAATQGLAAAAKEYGIMDEVTALRSLSVELYHENLTAVDACEGANIAKRFKKLGVLPSDHKYLVTVCKPATAP